jgi:hypothetical protein
MGWLCLVLTRDLLVAVYGRRYESTHAMTKLVYALIVLASSTFADTVGPMHNSTVNATTCSGKSTDLAPAECAAWQELFDSTNGPKVGIVPHTQCTAMLSLYSDTPNVPHTHHILIHSLYYEVAQMLVAERRSMLMHWQCRRSNLHGWPHHFDVSTA